MSSLQDLSIAVVGQVTAITFAAVSLMWFARHHAARRHSVGLLGLVLVLSSPLLVSALPQSAWWRSVSFMNGRMDSTATQSQDFSPRQWQSVSNDRGLVVPSIETTDIEPIDVDVTERGETPLMTDRTPSTTRAATLNVASTGIRSVNAAPSTVAGGVWRSWLLNLAGVVWLLGAVGLASRWAWQHWRLRWLVRSLSICSAADSRACAVVTDDVCGALNLQQLPPIVVSDLVPLPMVLGIWRPTIVLPRELLQSGETTRLRDVLIHEGAHVARRDAWVNAAQRLAAVVWWWHPGVLWLNRLIAQSREEVCDNFVLRHGNAQNYAQMLLELAEHCSAKVRFVPSLGLLGSRWTLEERITGLLNPGRNTMTQTKRRTVILTAALLGVLCLLVGGVRAVDDSQAIANTKQQPDAAVVPLTVEESPVPKDAEVKRSDARQVVAKRKIVIRGTCFDDDSNPFREARLRIFWIPEGTDEPVVLITETKTDQDGKFELRDIETEMPNRWDLVVAATADRHVSHAIPLHKDAAGVVELKMALGPDPGTLAGVVTDSQGQPVKGVSVFLPGVAYQPIPGVWSAVTDENGRYAITDLIRRTTESIEAFDPKAPLGSNTTRWALLLKHRDYALTQAWTSGSPQEVNVTLHPPAIVEGHVIDAVTNQPAANVIVWAQGVARGGSYRSRTDNEGRFRLLMTKDHYNISAQADDRIGVAVKALKAEAGGTVSKADIQLVRGGFVVGTVFGPNGQPISPPDNSVNHVSRVGHQGPAVPRTGAAVTSTKINPDGTYRLRVAPGQNYVYPMGGGHESATVTVKDGEETKLDFHLGNEPKGGFAARDPDVELRRQLSKQAEEEDAAETKGERKPAPSKPEASQRAATPTGKLLDKLESQQADAATWDESQLEEGVVTGVLVRASDGSPVADATVILHAGGSNKTRSDAEGRFRLEKIPARSYAYPMWAHQGNLITQKVSVSHLRTANPNVVKFAPLLLKMTAGKQARFTVISGLTGKPIPGATVRFGYPDRRLVTTDEQGIATVEGLLPEGYDVTIEAAGHARHVPKIELSPSEALTDYKITLTSGGVVRGVVVDEGGKPVPEIEVIYRIGSGTGFHGDAFRSDAEGRFQHRFLPLDTPVEVSSIVNRSLASAQTVTVTAKQREIEVRLVVPKRPAGGSITGTVKDQQGRPIVGADVRSRGNNANELKTKTDVKGAFVLHDLAKGFTGYEIGVSTNGFAPQLVPVNPGTTEKPGAVTVTLEPGHTIRGRVQFEGGAPAKGVLVSARSSSFFEMLRSYDVDDDGRFQIDSLPKDARFDAYLKGYARIMNVAWELDRAEPVTVTLESPGIIRGRVLDAHTKQPVTRFRVSLSFSRSRRPSDSQGTYENEWSHPGVSFESKKGEFVVAPLTNGFPAELTIEAEGYSRGVIERAVAAKGDRANTIDITLKPVDLSKLFTLSGQFLDHVGKPKSNVQLRLIVSTDPPTGNQDNNFNWSLIKNGQLGQKSYCEQFLSGTTNAEGRFEFKQILPGKSLQLAYWGSGVPQGKSMAFDETKAGGSDDVTIKLPEPARIRGSIDRSKLAAAESIHVSLNSQSFHDYKLKLRDDQTEFEVDDLPPGEFSVVVSSTSQSPSRKRATHSSRARFSRIGKFD